MVVEIGTSCIDTYAGKRYGIFIEPIKQYFDRLPNCIKENVAISNFEGTADFYYLSFVDIKKYRFPRWILGCNMMYKIHPKVKLWMKKLGVNPSAIKKDSVKVVRIKSIIEKYDVKKIDFLKIDTEGHDVIILNDFFDTVNILPTKLKFEHVHTNDSDNQKLIKRLESLGYKILIKKRDVVGILKVNRTIQRSE